MIARNNTQAELDQKWRERWVPLQAHAAQLEKDERRRAKAADDLQRKCAMLCAYSRMLRPVLVAVGDRQRKCSDRKGQGESNR